MQLLNANLATKVDIAALEAKVTIAQSDLEARITVFQSDLEAKIVNSHASLVKWIVGTSIAQGGIIIGVVSLLVRLL